MSAVEGRARCAGAELWVRRRLPADIALAVLSLLVAREPSPSSRLAAEHHEALRCCECAVLWRSHATSKRSSLISRLP
jgi:hypothetical protein